MGNSAPASILEELRSSRSRDAWAKFLRQYSPLIFQTCHFSTADADQAADCFLFVCEQLSRNNFRRLLRFRPEGAASFSTWLRVVVRNLGLDWRRSQFGRRRLFRSIARLPQLEGEVYRCRYERGLSLDETFMSLCPNFPGLTSEQLSETEAHVRESLSPRQLWLLTARGAKARAEAHGTSIGIAEENGVPEHEIADQRPNQESALADEQQRDQVRAAVARLPGPERLFIRLRFEEGLSLETIAGLTGLGDAQRVHRRIADILERLRKKVS